jgi:hypothetical protein
LTPIYHYEKKSFRKNDKDIEIRLTVVGISALFLTPSYIAINVCSHTEYVVKNKKT